MNDWVYLASEYYMANHPAQRHGQALFNSLYEHRPDIANQIHSTEYDPFFNDDRVVDFFRKVEELW